MLFREDIVVAKKKIFQSRISKVEPSVSDVGKKRKMKFMEPRLILHGELRKMKGEPPVGNGSP